MIAAIDVQYTGDQARAGMVLFKSWGAYEPVATFENVIENCAPYQAGKFFRRELPVITQTLDLVTASQTPNSIVVDCYVDLFVGKPGLGRYLFNAFQQKVAVIGVAKSRFRNSELAIEITRGDSDRPLFITSAGVDQQIAAEAIESMAGDFRIPKLLKLADSIARRGINGLTGA